MRRLGPVSTAYACWWVTVRPVRSTRPAVRLRDRRCFPTLMPSVYRVHGRGRVATGGRGGGSVALCFACSRWPILVNHSVAGTLTMPSRRRSARAHLRLAAAPAPSPDSSGYLRGRPSPAQGARPRPSRHLPSVSPPVDACPQSLHTPSRGLAHRGDLVARVWPLDNRIHTLVLALATAPRPDRWPRSPYWQWWYAVWARVLRGLPPDLKTLDAAEARRVNLPPHLR